MFKNNNSDIVNSDIVSTVYFDQVNGSCANPFQLIKLHLEIPILRNFHARLGDNTSRNMKVQGIRQQTEYSCFDYFLSPYE